MPATSQEPSQELWLNPQLPLELEDIRAILTARVIGQEDAIGQIVRALARYRAGMAGLDAPVAAFLLLGPTGVGKTLTAEVLADILHGSPRAVLKIHCAELRSDHELARMKGSPPGYVGWKECVPLFHDSKLKEVRLRDELAVVLFDEIEKAHPALWDLLLGLLDKGEVVLNDNTRSDFRKTMIFLTGNAGAREVSEALAGGMGFQPHTRGDVGGLASRAADRLFSPEFRNRLTATITYKPLNWDAVLRICKIELGRLVALLRDGSKLSVAVHFEAAAVEQIARAGNETAGDSRVSVGSESGTGGPGTVFGARHIKRAIDRLVKDPLANLLASGRLRHGEAVVVCPARHEGDQLRFRRKR